MIKLWKNWVAMSVGVVFTAQVGFAVTPTPATSPTPPPLSSSTTSAAAMPSTTTTTPAAQMPTPDAVANSTNNNPAASPQPTPPAPTLNAKAYIVVDATTGAIVAQDNADERLEPASLTKLMTMYVISQAIASGQIHLTDQVRISKKAWQTGGSKMFVRVGQMVPVEQLVQGIIVDSGNDACVAMAEYLAGSEDGFVALMNQEAQRLGMTNTHFNDVNGLPSTNHYSSAHDLSILARAIIKDYPDDYKWYSEKWFTFNGIKQPNRNRLLWRDPSVDGMKTGFTDDAGYCLVASAKRGDTRFVTVVLGAPNDAARFEDGERLLTYSFRFFGSFPLYKANDTLNTVRVWKGKDEKINVGVANDVTVTIPRTSYNNLKATMTLNEPIMAPVQQGQTLGTLQVTLDGNTLVSQPLIALQADPKGGFWTRMTDSISLMFKKKNS